MKTISTGIKTGPDRYKNIFRQIKRHKLLYLFILPCVVLLLVFCYYPMYGALLAFKDYNYNLGILGSPWAGLKHFKTFIHSPDFWMVMKNTIIISGLKIIFGFPAPIIIALLLNEVKGKKFKKVVQTMSYLPYFVSWVVVVSLMTVIFTPYGGIINNFRKDLGMEAVFFMGKKEFFYPMVVLSDIWKNAGWGSIIYLSALSGVNQELYEAATVDGAGRLKCTWHITLPSIKGTIGIMFIFAVGGILNAGFDQILLLQQPANNQISEILDTFVLKTGLNYGRFEYATAIGLFKSAFAFALMVLTNKITRKFMEVSIW
ncbi:ABC transporter permease subunit [Anaerocolumna sedimenticola]|uniref:ABC transporter permease subunit n=1 Tax=Anaerocolumna sedimenticola TaxID=2696063 RepID=A0A6P1TM44_9FIRM|nr:ABC transporter permease subunit [Anaerocolumna sedimenticola]QHQ60926.1 ABC transporter permease subunit [Anaerocolumna sedimenticola]